MCNTCNRASEEYFNAANIADKIYRDAQLSLRKEFGWDNKKYPDFWTFYNLCSIESQNDHIHKQGIFWGVYLQNTQSLWAAHLNANENCLDRKENENS